MMGDPFELEMYVKWRHESALREAAQARLVRLAQAGRPRRGGASKRALLWLGALLVRWGSGLQRAGSPTIPEALELPALASSGLPHRALTPV